MKSILLTIIDNRTHGPAAGRERDVLHSMQKVQGAV